MRDLLDYLRRRLPAQWSATPDALARQIIGWYLHHDLVRWIPDLDGGVVACGLARRVPDAAAGAAHPYLYDPHGPVLYVDWVAADAPVLLHALRRSLYRRWPDPPETVAGLHARHGERARRLPLRRLALIPDSLPL